MFVVQLDENPPGAALSTFAGVVMTNREAIDETLAVLEKEGRLRPSDSALVQMLRSMADSLDGRPGNSQMWREYKMAIRELMGDERGNDEIEKLFEELRSPIRHPAQN